MRCEAAQNVFFKNLTEESKTLFEGTACRMFFTSDVKQLKKFYTHFPWSRDTGQAFKNYKSRWSLLTVQSCFNSHRGNTSKFLLKRVDHFFGCSIQKVLYMRCEAAQKQLKKYFFLNLTEESRSLFLGAASRRFFTWDVKQLKSSSKSIFFNLTEESKPLFEGTASRSFSNKQVTY